MRKLIMKMSVSLDGFVCDSNGREDWIFKSGDEESFAWSLGEIMAAGLIIMGRKSFEKMAPYWQTATSPFAEPMNNIPKATFTRKGFKGVESLYSTNVEKSSISAPWSEAHIFKGDLFKSIKSLKDKPGKPIVAIGGAEFMQNLIVTGLIDEFHLAIHPVALGAGLPIFSGLEMPLYLKLGEVKVFPKGIVVHTYSL